MVEAVALGSEAIGFMCRSIAAWAEEVGKPKQYTGPDGVAVTHPSALRLCQFLGYGAGCGIWV